MRCSESSARPSVPTGSFVLQALFTQYDTLALSKRVEYAARGDEWLWLFDAKPKR